MIATRLEGSALEGAGQVDLADRVEGVGARAGGDVGGADFRGAGQLGLACSTLPRVLAAAGMSASGQ